MKVLMGFVAGIALVSAGIWTTRTEDSAVSAAALDGCLRTGSAATVYVLRGARVVGDEGGARDYLLVSVAGGIDMAAAVNHQVTVDGDVFPASEGPQPPEAANTVERALRRVAVKALKDSGAACR
jgi:hypothetical protein